MFAPSTAIYTHGLGLRNIWNTCITCSKISNIPYNLILATKFNDSSILITIISCHYFNLLLANEYVGDFTIPNPVIKYNKTYLQADQPIRLQYSKQIKLFWELLDMKKFVLTALVR